MSEINTMMDVKLPGKIRVRDVIEGEIVDIKENYILVNVNNFTEGKMYLDHFTQDKSVTSFKDLVNIGDKIICEVTKVDEEHGIINLTRKNQIRKENFDSVISSYNEKTNILVKVIKEIPNKGYLVSHNGFEFYLPQSQIDTTSVGSQVEVRILELNERRRGGIVSRRVIDNEIYYQNKEAEYNSINVGDKVVGRVDSILNYGVFVKFKYNQGLLRLNQLAHTFVKDPATVVSVGDEIEVKVIKKEKGRLELSKKALLLTPYQIYATQHTVGETVKAKVAQKLPFGVFLQLDEHVRGLLHVSEFSWNPNDNLMASLKFGDELEVAILSIDSNKERVSLSRKALIDNPWSRVKANEGDLVEAKITSIGPKGLNVTCLGVDGFVPVGEIVFEGNSSKMEDYFAIGDKVKGIIIELNLRQWILNISLKKYHNRLEREHFQEYLEHQEASDESVTLGDIYKDVLK